jgi:hypothetical protein
MQATANAGLSDWLIWNAGSVYTQYASLFSEPAMNVAPINLITSTSTSSSTNATTSTQ